MIFSWYPRWKSGYKLNPTKNLFLFCETIFAIFRKSSVILCLHNLIASVCKEWLFELVYKLNDKGKTRYLFQTTLKRYVTITFSFDLIFLEFFMPHDITIFIFQRGNSAEENIWIYYKIKTKLHFLYFLHHMLSASQISLQRLLGSHTF